MIQKIISRFKQTWIYQSTRSLVKKLFRACYGLSCKSVLFHAIFHYAKRVFCTLFPSLRRRLETAINFARIDAIMTSDPDGIYNNSAFSSTQSKFIDFSTFDTPIKSESAPLVSVIVPNFNHEHFLRDRLESVYHQTYSNFEVILLDDCSTDDSVKILEEYAKKYPKITKTSYNNCNSGRVFHQWNKGLTLANGRYIWIAESDDWCDLNFLEEMVPLLERQSVMLAFCNSDFIQEGKKIWSTGEYLWNLKGFNWETPFTISSHRFIEQGFAQKNMIPNVSSVLFRNIGQIPDEVLQLWRDMRLCGDWLFYLFIIKGGAVSYTNKTKNYYRIHKNSTSLKIQKTDTYYRETEQISRYIARNYHVDCNVFHQTELELKQHYITLNPNMNPNSVDEWYSVDKITAEAAYRRPNVAMCVFSMQIGGGETLPIYLADEMHRKGVNITVIDFNLEGYNPKIRNLLNPGIPMVHVSRPQNIGMLLNELGAEIVHSHHGSVDNLISMKIRNCSGIHQVITLHGMYETILTEDLYNLLNNVTQTCDTFFYIAQKNLVPFENVQLKENCKMIRINNALLPGIPDPVSLADYNIPEDSFVLCLCSRALFDKGWLEAVEAVKKANIGSNKQIHLFLLGDGEAYDALQKETSPFIHLTGMQDNTRAFFAASHMGFLPSKFAGESVPLVIIDSLICGKPVLASRIAEIPYQLTVANGELAGAMFDLHDWTIDVDSLAEQIRTIANDDDKYRQMCRNVPEAAEKFDISTVADVYLTEYLDVVSR